MDACLMQMAEIQYYVQSFASVMVASEETEGWDGWPYENLLDDLVSNPNMTAATLGYYIVERFYQSGDSTQSAVDLYRLNDLAAAVDEFAEYLIYYYSSYSGEINGARSQTTEFSEYTYVDLYHFAYNLANRAVPGALVASAEDVMYAVDSAVIHNRANMSNAYGISIYYPDYGFNSDYYDLDWAQDTDWDEFID